MLKRTGAVAVLVFLTVLAFPFTYNAFSVGLFSASGPKLEIARPGKCVEETSWMRNNHMKILLHVREDAVREGIRKVDHSLHGCQRCHPNREVFCNSCHEYVGVEPECWNCHIYPSGTT